MTLLSNLTFPVPSRCSTTTRMGLTLTTHHAPHWWSRPAHALQSMTEVGGHGSSGGLARSRMLGIVWWCGGDGSRGDSLSPVIAVGDGLLAGAGARVEPSTGPRFDPQVCTSGQRSDAMIRNLIPDPSGVASSMLPCAHAPKDGLRTHFARSCSSGGLRTAMGSKS